MTNITYHPDLDTVLTCDTKGCHAQTTLGHTDPQTPLAELARSRGWHARWRGGRDTRELRFSCPTHPGTGSPS